MKKKIITAVIVVAIVAVLAVGTVLLLGYFDANPTATVDPMEGHTIVDKDSSSVRSVKVTFADGTVSQILWSTDGSGTETATLAGSSMTVSSSAASELRRYASYLVANRVVEFDCQNMAEYGLAQPRATVTVNYADTKSVTFYLGILTPNKAGCYFRMDGETDVYTMFATTAEIFMRQGDDYRQLPTVPVSEDYVIALVRQNGDERASMALLGNVLGLATWEIVEPYRNNLDNDAFTAYLEEVLATAPSKFVAESPDDLAPYGLEYVQDFVTIVYTDSEGTAQNSFTIFFGGDVPDREGMRYIMFSTAKNVYAVSKDSTSYFDRNLYTIMEKNMVRYNIKYLDAITIYEPALDRTMNYTVQREEIVDGNNEPVLDDDGNMTYTETFYLDGELKDEQQARALYAAYIKLTSDGLIDSSKPIGDKVLEAEFTFNIKVTSGSENDYKKKMTICEYDTFNYAVLINDVPAFYIEKTKVAKPIQDNQLFIDGTLPSLKEQAGYED